MPLKKPTGDMYDFIDWIWNPVKGRCKHDCSYCYVKRIVVNRFKNDMKPIHLDEKEFRENLGEGNTIFVCDSCDLFASDVPIHFIHWVTGYCHQFPKNTYLFQTKNPRRLVSSTYGLSAINHKICTTIETNRFISEIMRNAPTTFDRADAMRILVERYGFKTMVTIEPIIDFDLPRMLELIKMAKPEQVNIGAKTGGHRGFPEPPAEKIRELIAELSTFTRVVEKDNLRRLLV